MSSMCHLVQEYFLLSQIYMQIHAKYNTELYCIVTSQLQIVKVFEFYFYSCLEKRYNKKRFVYQQIKRKTVKLAISH